MRLKPGMENALWMGAGAVMLAIVLVLVWHFRQRGDPAQQLAFKATRVDLVGRMQLGLARSSEAEKSAVLASTEKDSRVFADQARAASEEVDQERKELANLVADGGTHRETELLSQFGQTFGNLRRIDDEVLQLAVKSTNLKAYALLFGPAASALAEIDASLSRVLDTTARSANGKQVALLAFGAQTSVLRIQALLAPHIAEESDPKMDLLEASMAKDENLARRDLDGLEKVPGLKGNADLERARSAFTRYAGIKTQIVSLSRENTNVRSLALSLNQKRNAMALCMEVLAALKDAILEEPIAGVTYGRLPKPR